jgi:SAM-dependent methyltransferase
VSRLYPEYNAGGFSRDDEHIIFYSRVNALVHPGMRILDFGAGRGKLADDPDSYKRRLRCFRGRCARVVGVDIDPIVRRNPLLDEAHVIEPRRRLPFPEQSFDLVLSWAVWEHLEDPSWWAGELTRVVRPGGWICAWTPNRYGYIALGARLIPQRYHARVLGLLFRKPVGEDAFPTFYRLNTRRAIRQLFAADTFEDFSYAYSGEPRYHGENLLIARGVRRLNALLPEIAKAYLHVFLRKRGDTPVSSCARECPGHLETAS